MNIYTGSKDFEEWWFKCGRSIAASKQSAGEGWTAARQSDRNRFTSTNKRMAKLLCYPNKCARYPAFCKFCIREMHADQMDYYNESVA